MFFKRMRRVIPVFMALVIITGMLGAMASFKPVSADENEAVSAESKTDDVTTEEITTNEDQTVENVFEETVDTSPVFDQSSVDTSLENDAEEKEFRAVSVLHDRIFGE